MESIRLGDLLELLQGSAFSAWWTEWSRAAAALGEARARHDDLLAQAEIMALRSTLAQRAGADAASRAGEAEDAAARAAAEAQALERRALGLVGEHEDQARRISDPSTRLGAAERARGKDRAGARGRGRAAKRPLEDLRRAHDADDRERARLREDVEAAWAESLERSLLGAEEGMSARLIRRDAERRFEEAEERRVRARQLAADADAAGRERHEAERRRAALLAQARERFGCAAGESFLYWRRADDGRSALAVALVDREHGANVPVKAMRVYAVGRQHGAASLEPARDGVTPAAREGDRRVEELLLGPREGARGDDEGPSSPQGA